MTELLSGIISANQRFVQNEKWREFFPADGKPKRKAAVLTCMDRLSHFKAVEDNVKWVCRQIQTSPLLPKTIQVHGLVMNSQTGQIRVA